MGRRIALLAAFSVLASGLFDQNEPERFEAIEDHFKYGSIGAEDRAGVPYWIWLALPEAFPDLLPDKPGRGYERFGFVYDAPPRQRPIGTSRRERQIPMLGLNCAVCHTGVVRDAPGAAARIVPGMPAHQFDFQAYFHFLAACGRDQRFTADTILPAIRSESGLRVFRRAGVPAVRDFPDARRPEGAGPGVFVAGPPAAARSRAGRYVQSLQDAVRLRPPRRSERRDGRSSAAVSPEDPGGPVAALGREQRQGGGAQQERGDRGGRVAGVARSAGHAAHRGVDLGAEAAGVPAGEDRRGARRARPAAVREALRRLPRPGRAADRAGGGAGRDRHGPGAAELLQPRARREDEHAGDRLSLEVLALPQDQRLRGHAAGRGVAAGAVSAQRLRAHPARSVKRARAAAGGFYRGYEVYDYRNAGFVSSGAEAEREGCRFDTSLRGNGRQGHWYGVDLPSRDKDDLIEYLKTL